MATEPVVLEPEECFALLRSQRVGRVAVTHRALPMIVPVNYVMDGRTVLFRTAAGGLLDRACRSAVVAFEVDDVEADGFGGVSVVVVGVADAVDDSQHIRALGLGLLSPVAQPDDVFITVTPGSVTGRRVGAPQPVAV